MPFRRSPDPAATAVLLDELDRSGGEALFLFFGTEQPGTGQSWCPDCVTADPVLRAALARLRPDLVVHECPVGQRGDWKGNDAHPYRTEPRLRITRIPTLVRRAAGAERGRLIEGECADEARLAAFLAR